MYLCTESGEIITSGSVLRAVRGPHKGRAFRFLGIHDDRQRLVVAFHGAHPFRHSRTILHPSVFALHLRDEITRMRAVLNRCHHVWQRVDEGLVMGVLALVPLALFEAFHGSEMTRELLLAWFGGGSEGH